MISTQPFTSAYISITPPLHRGLAVLDRSLFTVELPILAARVLAPETTKFARTQAKQFLLRLPRRTSSILPDPTSKDHRLIYLGVDPSLPIPDELAQILKDADIPPLVKQTVVLDYDYWTSDQIINAVLPVELLDESPSAFTQVGHIAHLNVREEYLPYRHLIGQIILDKNKSLRTVVNKLDTIDNEFRNFKMEVLAGDDDFVVQTSESNCMFHFDFSLVYWNSRLQGEHLRLVESFSKEDVVVDAFAGVGPFAVPAGKKGCGVLASDLNPASAGALVQNTKINKVETNVRTANEDARAFIKQSVVDLWNNPFPAYITPISSKALGKQRRSAAAATVPTDSTSSASSLSTLPLDSLSIDDSPPLPSRKLVDHFVMNLPGSAIEFLDAFRGLYLPLYKLDGAREAVEKKNLYPMVHCYCFTKNMADQEGDILERATKAMGIPVTTDLKDYKLRYVRDVAPKKEMYCLEFRLSPEMVL